MLEILAERDLLDDFYQAIDADDIVMVENILDQAGLDQSVIEKILSEINNATGVF